MGVRIHKNGRAQSGQYPGCRRLKKQAQDLADALAVTISASVEFCDRNVLFGKRKGHELKGFLEGQRRDHRRNDNRVAEEAFGHRITNEVDVRSGDALPDMWCILIVDHRSSPTGMLVALQWGPSGDHACTSRTSAARVSSIFTRRVMRIGAFGICTTIAAKVSTSA